MPLSSGISLHIEDKEINDQYVLSRKRSMMFISLLILSARLILGFDLIVRFSLNDHVTFLRMLSYELGVLVHIVWLILFWRFPLKLYKINALVVMLSFQFFLINTN
jgi:hypothetical protein